MQKALIIEAARQYVTQQYQEHPHPQLVYHNLVHTKQVVQSAEQICAHYRLPEDELVAVFVAAWFHDLGYLLGTADRHEENGAAEAVSFLQQQEVTVPIQEMVKRCILATKMPQSPQSLPEQIVCDADLSHLGREDFKVRNKLLKQEVEMVGNKKISGIAWTTTTIVFLEQHHYFTEYCQTRYKQQKEENLRKLKSKLEKKQEAATEKEQAADAALAGVSSSGQPTDNTVVPIMRGIPAPENGGSNVPKVSGKEAGKDKPLKEKKLGRGVETMFRITSTNHIRLSSMADSKANIMISVNSIIISVILSVLVRRLEDYPNMVIPSFIFLFTSVTTIIFAILATRPNITSGVFTKDDIHKEKANLLFFGNFYKMSLQDYDWGMKQMMNNPDYLYGSMTKDVYHLGVVLGRKYKLLRISYNIFMFGLIISVLAFMTAAIFFPVKGY
ncbi:Pycsar system effector family protein [Chitinophaga defluvii]|uniref:Pycsar system effector family protein n=1 Tax=Chitinophaga defluvii TaxID=3163343 RepID=A0ABV2T612_9BACT